MLLLIHKFAGFSEDRVHYKARTPKGKTVHLIYELHEEAPATPALARHFRLQDPADIDEPIARKLEHTVIDCHRLFDTAKESVWAPNPWRTPIPYDHELHPVFETRTRD
ncbi:hypothetical protein [Burkholderia gladioli]|uniref:hypothetical protein n=1 Tax=Burkholderia gladioli TaxID=28095 RepID=UPI00285C7620|nr:hypothetical protein [Burkholderia gladioli]MDR8091109.1 hypothetical protein [Burkholderia gladioli]